jgi:hypothetical protein
VVYRFNGISTKIPITFFTEIVKSIQKSTGNLNKPQIDKAVLIKKSNAGDASKSDFKLYCRAIVTKQQVLIPKQTCTQVE